MLLATAISRAMTPAEGVHNHPLHDGHERGGISVPKSPLCADVAASRRIGLLGKNSFSEALQIRITAAETASAVKVTEKLMMRYSAVVCIKLPNSSGTQIDDIVGWRPDKSR